MIACGIDIKLSQSLDILIAIVDYCPDERRNGYVIGGNDEYSVQVSSLEECEELCRYEEAFVCSSVDYLNQDCFLSKLNSLNAGGNLYTNHGTWKLTNRCMIINIGKL